ncbi:hypothetical protein GCM10007160_14830 [Litchfieldella qijiaojingensis]|uniref:Uncharacterized protein n=1 Tax=Litchfieldella qijiaojingensis TaxID=980347 RepID=A0ABQ2YLM0_9GAMM|nr:hypothetical protein GCM10007160_14830 [Halomonas qijiaojingensis]
MTRHGKAQGFIDIPVQIGEVEFDLVGRRAESHDGILVQREKSQSTLTSVAERYPGKHWMNAVESETLDGHKNFLDSTLAERAKTLHAVVIASQANGAS